MGFFGPSSHSSSRHGHSHGHSHHSHGHGHYQKHSSHHNQHSSSSYYRRRPRDGYVNRIIHQLRRFVRDLLAYARRHPVKVFMLVIMPLLTGGALSGVLRKFGIVLPMGLSAGARMFGGGGGGYHSYSGSSRRGGGFGGDLGGRGAVEGLMKLVQAFM
ncbi:MAG: hypothetical protein M1823_002313 [Watsoniomyces obsoletus]|nr:MAG: hypothetical protein M1823_002313 [Watsoniomyces obsoletus]